MPNPLDAILTQHEPDVAIELSLSLLTAALAWPDVMAVASRAGWPAVTLPAVTVTAAELPSVEFRRRLARCDLSLDQQVQLLRAYLEVCEQEPTTLHEFLDFVLALTPADYEDGSAGKPSPLPRITGVDLVSAESPTTVFTVPLPGPEVREAWDRAETSKPYGEVTRTWAFNVSDNRFVMLSIQSAEGGPCVDARLYEYPGTVDRSKVVFDCAPKYTVGGHYRFLDGDRTYIVELTIDG